MKRPFLVELFSGTGSVGAEARKRGWEVLSVDADPKTEADVVVDVLRWDYKSVRVPDLVWASPPCQTYSIAAAWVKHREPKTGNPLSQAAKAADHLLRKLLTILRYWLQRNPNLKFVIENPRGFMRTRAELEGLHRSTTSYNQYGWPIQKPTDFWSNFELHLKPARSNKSLGKRALTVGTDNGAILKQLSGKSRRSSRSSSATLTRSLYQIPPKLVATILNQMA